jgi:hypothetical protein
MKKGADSNYPEKKQDGFIAFILIFIIALALLKYFFDWSIFEASATPQGQETVSYTRNLIDTIWHYLQAPIAWIWNNILWPILGFVWRAFENLITSANSAKT